MDTKPVNEKTARLQATLKALKSQTLWLRRAAWWLAVMECSAVVAFVIWKDQLRFFVE